MMGYIWLDILESLFEVNSPLNPPRTHAEVVAAEVHASHERQHSGVRHRAGWSLHDDHVDDEDARAPRYETLSSVFR